MTTIGGDLLASRGGGASRLAVSAPAGKDPKLWASAQEFEAVFLNTMVSEMFAGLGDEGPMGGGPATGAWRGLLTEEWSKTIAAKGGVGLADHVYRELLALQEARP